MVVPLQMPTRPRLYQVLKERYLFVLAQLARSTSCTKSTSEIGYHHQDVS